MRKKINLLGKSRWLQPVLIVLALYAVMFAILVMVVIPERYDIKIGFPAPVTIFANKDVEDTVTTQKLRDDAAAQVEYTYRSVDETVVSHVISDFSNASLKIVALRDSYTLSDVEAMSDGDIESLSNDVGVMLARSDLETIVSCSLEDLDAVISSARTLVRDVLNSTLPEGQETSAVSKISRDLLAKQYDNSLVAVAVDIVRATLRPNMLIDEESTELNRQKARDTVETQMCVKGEAVVREGDIVTESEYQILALLGLIDDATFDIQLILGIALISMLVIAALAMYIHIFDHEVLENPRKLVLLALIIVIVLVCSALLCQINAYLMPVALGIMLVATLLDRKLSLFVNALLGLLTALFATVSTGVLSVAAFSTLITALVSGPIVVIVISRHHQRTSMLLAGVAVSASNFITTFSVGLINSASASAVAINAAWAAAGGVLSAVMCIGIQPLMEWLFNLVTNAKLLELSNPNQSLLHRLLLEAPGTYHHSIIVANLADAAASAIGANALLARVGAYYHDVGKLKRPLYFKENQIGDNPHDRTDPRVSAAILTAHPRDGMQMAQKEHLPMEILEMIQQHHGDSPVLYFYDKAKKLYGEDIDISAFRYEGPRPARRETAVVMLADVVEAATRSMPSHEPQKIEQLIRKLLRDKMTDGQLDKSQLTFHDLDIIADAFYTVLSGVFHERIEYPDVKLPPREQAAPQAEENK